MSPEWVVAAQFEAYNEHDVDTEKSVLRMRGIYSAERSFSASAFIGSHNVYYVKYCLVVNKFISHIHVAINQHVSNF